MLLKFVFLRKGNKVFMDLELNSCCPHRTVVSSSEFTLVKAGCGISLSCCCCWCLLFLFLFFSFNICMFGYSGLMGL